MGNSIGKQRAQTFVNFSSRVNDGICDCCDGKAQCANTCSEAGNVWREKLKKKIATFRVGLEARNRDIEHSQLMIEKDKRELANLKLEEKNLKDVVQKLGGIYSSVQIKVDFHMH